MRAIADAVGCAPPSIYLHFSDKDELIRSVCGEHFARLDAESSAAAAEVDDPVESLRRRAHAYVRFGVENPEHYRILFMGRLQPTTEQVPRAKQATDDEGPGATTFRHLVEAVQGCIDAGRFAPGEPDLIATQLWTVVHGVASLAISTPGFPFTDLDQFLDDLLTLVCKGLAP